MESSASTLNAIARMQYIPCELNEKGTQSMSASHSTNKWIVKPYDATILDLRSATVVCDDGPEDDFFPEPVVSFTYLYGYDIRWKQQWPFDPGLRRPITSNPT